MKAALTARRWRESIPSEFSDFREGPVRAARLTIGPWEVKIGFGMLVKVTMAVLSIIILPL